MPARETFLKAWEKRHEIFDKSGQFLDFGTESCPWKEQLFDFEEEENCQGSVKFVFMVDGRKMVRVCTVPPTLNSFAQRITLNPAWHGMREKELQEVSGIETADFVHASGFLGGAWSVEGAMKMATDSIAAHDAK